MDPEKKSLNFIFPTKYVVPKSLKFSHWPSKNPQESLASSSGKEVGSDWHRLPQIVKVTYFLSGILGAAFARFMSCI